MAQHSIEFQFQGEGREAEAKELEALLADTFADWPQHVTEKTSIPTSSNKSDPVAVAALILSIPAALLATWDLAQRIRLKEKVDRLINWAKEKAKNTPAGHPNLPIHPTVHLPDGRVLPLDQLKPEELLDVLAQLAEKE